MRLEAKRFVQSHTALVQALAAQLGADLAYLPTVDINIFNPLNLL